MPMMDIGQYSNLLEVDVMGQIANQMLIDAILKLKEKLRNKNTKKRNVTQENTKKGKEE